MSNFQDPVLRCEQCNKLTHVKYLGTHGGCCHCGNRRFKNVLGLDVETEVNPLKKGELEIGVVNYTIPESFFNLFTEREDV